MIVNTIAPSRNEILFDWQANDRDEDTHRYGWGTLFALRTNAEAALWADRFVTGRVHRRLR
jgi:hypothetical protein